ncbi:gcvT [Symbiodinium microadriaticum]|nr:gcvT [Symbiodinium microadriaticum]
MVPFAGYHLPVQYEGQGVLKEHLHTRSPNCASVFDVSHMGQLKWEGKDVIKFLEKMVVGDIASMKPGESKLSLIMNENGGIVDDTVITVAHDHVNMVVNGACKEKDIAHFAKYMGDFEVTMHYLSSLQLLALQVENPHIMQIYVFIVQCLSLLSLSALFAEPEVLPAGLGARDSLRLEAGLCLYGHDLNEDINPVEGTLTWTIG